ncbi:hypothetical protein TWF281_001487 [Arthrobotrys megalospora]
MRIPAFITLSFVALLSLSSAIPTAPSPKLDVEAALASPITITGSMFPGGPVLNLTGTIQDLFPQIKEKYPNWDPQADITPNTKPSIGARYLQGRPVCFAWSGYPADRGIIAYVVAKSLINLGNLGCYARGCQAVGCAANSGVFLCPSSGSITVPCKRIGETAFEIAKACARVESRPNFFMIWTEGNWWDTNGFNIAVAGANCPGGL